MQAKNYIFLRHGDTGYPGCYIGSSDVPVTDKGLTQARKTGILLQQLGIDTIFSSPMLRCRQTLDALKISCSSQLCEHLREIDFGRWEGKNFQQISQQDPLLVDSWIADPEQFSFPDGESLGEFRQRVVSFKNQLQKTTDENILVVSHGGVIRHLLCLFLGLEPKHFLVFDVQPGCYCSIRMFEEGGVLTGFNIKG